MRFNSRLSTALAAAAVTSAVAAATAFAHTEVKSTYPAKGKSASKNIGSVSVDLHRHDPFRLDQGHRPGRQDLLVGQRRPDPRKV